jgi:N utilization substance protein B
MHSSSSPGARVPRSLLKKHAARAAAVQCLYLRSYEPAAALSAEEIITRVLEMQENEADESVEFAVAPDMKLLRGIVSGSGSEAAVLEERLGVALGARWAGERLTPLMKAILRAAMYELLYHRELKPAIVLDEYVSLAADYFAAQETNLLNGLLQELARAARASDAG